jgi:UDP-N-acetylmuramate--alanine ligase
MEDFITGKSKIHLIGIGGSGMYPLSQILQGKGYSLTGSDNNETATLDAVRKMGIKVFLGHNAENVEGADLVIYSAAIMQDNPELSAARAKGIETRERAELLGLVTSWYNNAICVSGTHGKTTVSSMLTQIFLSAEVDLSAVIGGKLKAIGGSGKSGTSEIMVCEACEFNDTFLRLYPDVSVILNIDEDHLDYFKTLENLRNSFTQFCDKTTKTIVYNGDDENTVTAVGNSSFTGNKVTFGWSRKNDFYPADEELQGFGARFNIIHNGKTFPAEINVPGKHNILNATASFAAAYTVKIDPDKILRGLKEFRGAGRRFEIIYSENGITAADDYAHHPAEITAVLTAAKNMGFRHIWAIHQPFTFSRTFTLLDDFAASLELADRVILTEIMGSREVNSYGVKSADLAEKLSPRLKTKVIADFDEAADYLAEHLQDGDLAITLGCGDVYKIADKTAEKLQEKKK